MAQIILSYKVYGSIEQEIPDEILNDKEALEEYLDNWRVGVSLQDIHKNLSEDCDDISITDVSSIEKTFFTVNP